MYLGGVDVMRESFEWDKVDLCFRVYIYIYFHLYAPHVVLFFVDVCSNPCFLYYLLFVLYFILLCPTVFVNLSKGVYVCGVHYMFS